MSSPRLQWSLALVGMLGVAAPPLDAQLPRWDDTTRVPRRCLGPDGQPPRAATLLHLVPTPAAEAFGPVPEGARPSVDLMAEVVARHLRTVLGAPDGQLPALDSGRAVDEWNGWVTVVGRRDGSMRWFMPWEEFPRRSREPTRRSLDTEGLRLLAQALDSAAANDPFTWPEKVEGDSIAFRLRFDWPRPDGAGRFDPIPARHAAAIVPIMVPAIRPVRPAGAFYFELRRWPGDRERHLEVDLLFEVDSTGRVVPGSVRDLWPTDEPRPVGREARRYEEFIADIRRSLERTRYVPARVGTCTVAAPARRTFTFAFLR